MKKVLCSVLAIMLLFCGCSADKGPKKVDDYKWKLDIVQDSAHMVIASSESSSFKCDVNVEMNAKMDKDSLIIDDTTNSKTYIIDFVEDKVEEDSVKYTVKAGSLSGNATVSVIKNGNKSTPTLYITLGGYSLRFVSADK